MLTLLALLVPAQAGFFVDGDGSPCASLADAAAPVAYVDEWGRVYEVSADKTGTLSLEDAEVRAEVLYFDPGDTILITDDQGSDWSIDSDGIEPLGKSFGAPLSTREALVVALPGRDDTLYAGTLTEDKALLVGVFVLEGTPDLSAAVYAKAANAALAGDELLSGVALEELGGDYVNELGMGFGYDSKAEDYVYLGDEGSALLPSFVDWGIDAKHGLWLVDEDAQVYLAGAGGIARDLNDLLYVELDAGR